MRVSDIALVDGDFIADVAGKAVSPLLSDL